MNGLALCTGGGGLEAGLHIVFPEYRTVCAVERQAYAAAAFVEWMEKTGMGACPVWDDVTTFDPEPWRGLVDILSAGYPCQPFSYAGKGLCENDPRHLWPYIIRNIRALMPPVVWLENVKAHLTRGFNTVRDDLERIGYRVTAGIFSAAEVGAPHLRERLFILGLLANSDGLRAGLCPERQEGFGFGRSGDAGCEELGNTHSERLQGRARDEGTIDDTPAIWPWPAGRGSEQHPWEKPRLVKSGMGGTTHGVGTRNEQLLMLGNGVVPVAGALAFVALWRELNANG